MIKIISFVFCVLFIIIILKQSNVSTSPLVSLLAVSVLCVISLISITPTIEFVSTLTQMVEFDDGYFKILLKCIGICILYNICSNICKDCGESSLAYGTEIVCKFTVISLTLPIYVDVFNWIIKIWEST